MIKEIKRQRELLRFKQFIDDTVQYGSGNNRDAYFHVYYNSSSPNSCIIYDYGKSSHILNIFKRNIINTFGDSLSDDDIVGVLMKKHIIYEYNIHT